MTDVTWRLSLSQMNQARSMMLAQHSIAPNPLDDGNRQAHIQVMESVVPSMFFRTICGVLVAVGLDLFRRATGLPVGPMAIASWAAVFAIPAVALALWIALVAMRVRNKSIRATLESPRSPVFLWRTSLAGYVSATVASAIGVVYFPQLFP